MIFYVWLPNEKSQRKSNVNEITYKLTYSKTF